jgi:hypothetical protein
MKNITVIYILKLMYKQKKKKIFLFINLIFIIIFFNNLFINESFINIFDDNFLM